MAIRGRRRKKSIQPPPHTRSTYWRFDWLLLVLGIAWTAPLLVQVERPRGKIATSRQIASLGDTFDRRPDCVLRLFQPGTGVSEERQSHLLYRDPEAVSRGGTFPGSVPFEMVASPLFVLVKQECKPLLDRAAEETLAREQQEGQENAYFPFRASRPTQYCDVRPTGWEGCSGFKLLNNGELIARVTSHPNQVPAALQPIVSFLVDPRSSEKELRREDATIRRISERLTEEGSHYVIYVVQGESAQVTPLQLETLNTDRGSRTRWISAGEMTHIRMQRFQGNDEWRTIGPEDAEEKIQSSMRAGATGGGLLSFLGPSRFNRALIARITAGAQTLSRYWQNALTLLDQEDLSPVNLEKFNAQNLLLDIGAVGSLDPPGIEDIERVTAAAIQEASLGLESAVQIPTILAAASYWWSARAMQIAAGCQNLPSGERLVTHQYGHQQCRRIFAGRAYSELNQRIATGGELDLSSLEWIMNFALGSRAERGELFTRALPLILQQIERNTFPSRAVISMITHEVLQTAEELRLQKSLTWNGLQPISDGQLTSMNRFLSEARTFFPRLAQSAVRFRLRDPPLFSSSQRAWRFVSAPLRLGRFPSTGSLASSRLDDGEIQEIVIDISQLSSRDVAAVQRLLLASDATMAQSREVSRPICRAWVDWLAGAQLPSVSLVGNYSSPCGRLIRSALERPAELRPLASGSLHQQCLQDSHALACHLLVETEANLSARLPPPAQWGAFFSSVSPQSTAYLRALIRLQRAALQVSPSWRRAVGVVHRILKQRALATLSQLPSRRDINNCYDPDEWNRQLASDREPTADQLRSAVHPDCQAAERFGTYWLETIRLCQAVRRDAHARASFFAPLETYAFWLREMDHFRRILPTERANTQAEPASSLFFALSDLFVEPRGPETHSTLIQRFSPVYCPTETRERARVGQQYSAEFGDIVRDIRAWENYGRVATGGSPPSDPTLDAVQPFVF